MKHVIALMLLMLMALSAGSQTTSNAEDNVIRAVSITKDTVALIMHVEDARLILGDLLDYEIVDSLLTVYQVQDSINMLIIKEKDIIIEAQSNKIDNYVIMTNNFEHVIRNKDSEIAILFARIEELKKEVKKERNKKRIFMALSVAGPVATAILMGVLLGG